MAIDEKVICYGLGVTDPKSVFGTTKGLEETYGNERVFDMPTSENAMTGVSIGASLNNIKSVVTHQRLDFFLLAMDQIVNSAAKYYYMYGSQISVPITVRLIIGRGWGQGPTHSQNLQAWFAHIPGLKVVMPSTPQDAKTLLLSSIFDPNPVIFLEHRWLHESSGKVEEKAIIETLGTASKLKKGSDLTIVAMSYMAIEALHAVNVIETQTGKKIDLIDLRSLNPIDWETIFDSVEKSGSLLVVDTGYTTGSIAGEIIAKVCLEKFNFLKIAPKRLAMPDIPEPTSFGLTKGFYVRAHDIGEAIISLLDIQKEVNLIELQEPNLHDIPGSWFKGPF